MRLRSQGQSKRSGRRASRPSVPAMPRWLSRKTTGLGHLAGAVQLHTEANSGRGSIAWYTLAGCVLGINVPCHAQ